MAYPSKRGRRPVEWASKASHSQLIRDAAVQAFLARCRLPSAPDETTWSDERLLTHTPVEHNPIRHIIAVDGGYQVVAVRRAFPAATLCFFQVGALTFRVADLQRLRRRTFIPPEEIARLKRIQRLKFVLPVRGIGLEGTSSLTHAVRRALYDFCAADLEGESLLATLRWFIFGEYGQPRATWELASCPGCGSKVELPLSDLTPAYTWPCPACNEELYLTDVLRLHEDVDDELGAGSILGHALTAVEQLVLVHLIRLLLRLKPKVLREVLFIKDGPLAFFGPPLSLQKAMVTLVRYLFAQHDLYLVGLEKSGSFVDHADALSARLAPGSVVLLDNAYIYRHILPGKADLSHGYGHTTYYGHKLFFKTQAGELYVVTAPTPELTATPTVESLPHLPVLLTNIAALRCDMYDSALVPVALVNHLVSLSQHPSTRILQRFARERVRI